MAKLITIDPAADPRWDELVTVEDGKSRQPRTRRYPTAVVWRRLPPAFATLAGSLVYRNLADPSR